MTGSGEASLGAGIYKREKDSQLSDCSRYMRNTHAHRCTHPVYGVCLLSLSESARLVWRNSQKHVKYALDGAKRSDDVGDASACRTVRSTVLRPVSISNARLN